MKAGCNFPSAIHSSQHLNSSHLLAAFPDLYADDLHGRRRTTEGRRVINKMINSWHSVSAVNKMINSWHSVSAVVPVYSALRIVNQMSGMLNNNVVQV